MSQEKLDSALARLAVIRAEKAAAASAAKPIGNEGTATHVTRQEAARYLNVSRPYVTMITAAGAFGELGPDDLIPLEALEAKRAEMYLNAKGSIEDMVQAGIDGGFYDREDSEYTNIVRDQSKTKPT